MDKALWILIGVVILLVFLVGRQVNVEVESINPKISELQMRIDWIEEDIVVIGDRIGKLEKRLDTAIRMIPDYHDPGWYEDVSSEELLQDQIDEEILIEDTTITAVLDPALLEEFEDASNDLGVFLLEELDRIEKQDKISRMVVGFIFGVVAFSSGCGVGKVLL